MLACGHGCSYTKYDRCAQLKNKTNHTLNMKIKTLKIERRNGKGFVVTCLFCGVIGYHISSVNLAEVCRCHTHETDALCLENISA